MVAAAVLTAKMKYLRIISKITTIYMVYGSSLKIIQFYSNGLKILISPFCIVSMWVSLVIMTDVAICKELRIPSGAPDGDQTQFGLCTNITWLIADSEERKGGWGIQRGGSCWGSGMDAPSVAVPWGRAAAGWPSVPTQAPAVVRLRSWEVTLLHMFTPIFTSF